MRLVVENAKKRLGDTMALDGTSLSIGDGILGILGRNGAGKSTLLRALSGVYGLDEGTIALDGERIYLQQPAQGAYFLPDDPYYPSGVDLRGLGEFLSCFHDFDKEAFAHYVSLLELPNKKLKDYSKGMRRQAFLAAALSVRSRFLLLDEAFDGLDPLTLRLIGQELSARFNEKQPGILVISSHNVHALFKIADTILLMEKGRTRKLRNVDALLTGLRQVDLLFQGTIRREDIERLGVQPLSFRSSGRRVTFLTRDISSIERIEKVLHPLSLSIQSPDPEELLGLLAEDER